MNYLKKDFNKILIKMMLIFLLASIIVPIQPIQKVYAAEPFDSLAVQAVRNNYGLHQGGTAVDGGYGNFSAYDAYILTQAGADLSTWVYGGTSLKDSALTMIDATIANPNEMTTDWSGNPAFARSAKKIAYEYLTAKGWNETTRANQLLAVLQARQSASGNGSFDSNAFSDLPAFEALGRAGSIASIDTVAAITNILASQDGTTGAWSSAWNDVQATAQAVRALKYLEPLADGQTAAVQTAINNGTTWLQARQLANGGFRDASNFDDPLVDTAEIILTVNLLGIDPTTWNVGGKSAVDYMQDNALNDDKTFGTSKNLVSNTWALDAYRLLGSNVAADTILAVQVTPATANIEVGLTQQYTAQSFRMDGTSADISATATWTVNDTSIATVNASGLVTGVAAGNAVVTASSQGVNGTANAVVFNLYNDRSVQAVRNNYGLHQGGTAVDGGYGNFGAYDAYILTQAGADLSTWVYGGTSLKDSALTMIDATIANPNEMTTDWSGNPAFARSAKKIACEYLAAKGWNETTRANQLLAVLQARQTASGNGSFDSNAFSDLPAFETLGRAGSIASIDTAAAITAILASQDGTTGAWSSAWNDVQATAQAVRALKYLEPLAGGQTLAVQTAINNGTTWLQARQLANGGFRDASNFDDPLVDTAEIILTVNLLGIDPTTWNVGGKSAVDYMRDNALNDDKTFGTSKNLVSNTWALDAYRLLGGNVAAGTILAVQVTPATANITVGNTQQYTAQTFKMDGTSLDVSSTATWTINDTSIATVNVSGLVTGVATGNAVVTASSQGVDGTANTVVASAGGGIIIPQGTPIQVRVTGKSGETLYAQNTVYLKADDRNSRNDLVGITPVGALNKTGLSYDYDSLDYIHTIAGQGYEGMNGWMYKINGSSPGVSAINYTLSANDVVWWFYSTDASNITVLEQSLKLQIKAETGDNLILAALEKGENVKIALENRENELAEISPENIKKLEGRQKEMTLTNKGIDVTFAPNTLNTEQINKAFGEVNSTLQIGAKEISSAEKQEILANAGIGQSSGIFDIGGKIFDLTAQIVRKDGEEIIETEKITSFNEPVKVIIELPGNLTDEDIAKLTAIRYEKNSAGSIVPVKLGGSYDAATKTFTFYTDKFSHYGVVKADSLVTISMGINMMTTTHNGERGYTDVPPILLNNRTMVPLRFIAENLGAQVEWFEKTRTVEIRLKGKLLNLIADEIVPGMDTAPTIRGGRILVPLRFVSESFGARVTWFPSTQRIDIVL